MIEKEFQTLFNKWLRHVHYKTGVFELKAVSKNSIPFSAVQEHQETALYAVKHGSLAYKIPDDTRGFKPFDCFLFVMSPAFVVIMFNAKEKAQKEFYLIDIDSWLAEKELARGVRKSLTCERAREIGKLCTLGG